MEKFQNFVSAIASIALKASGVKVNQVQRNALKNDALETLLSEFATLEGVNLARTNDGIVIEVSNDELGSIHLELDLKVKDLDFDFEGAIAERKATLDARTEKAEKTAEKKAKLASEKAEKSKVVKG